MKKIGCVIVLYNPDLLVLRKGLNAIQEQVSMIALIDNSSEPNIPEYLLNDKIYYHFIGENKGIAYAQNIGIKFFEKNEFEYILFLDQDSIVSPDFVNKLYKSYSTLLKDNILIGAVGPRAFNRGENKKYQATIMKGKKISEGITEVNELISSGSLVPIENFSCVGYMDEDLFIDGVDHEWCWRAKSLNKLRFFIIEDAILSHQVGEGDRWFFFKRISIQTPFRIYFRYRNYIKLLSRDYVPIYWKVSNGIKNIIKYFYYPMLVRPRKDYIVKIHKGIIDGFKKNK